MTTGPLDDRAEFRPRSALWIAVAVWVLCLLNLVMQVVVNDWTAALRAVPIVAFIATAAWVLFVAPAVVVDHDGAILKNPTRDIRIAWSAIEDVQPSFSLTVVAARRHYRAWAAPGGTQASRFPVLVAEERIVAHLPLPDDGSFEMSALVDPEQAARTPSLAAAATIRRGWQLAQQHATTASVTTTGSDGVSVRWHALRLIVLAVLLAAAIVTIVV